MPKPGKRGLEIARLHVVLPAIVIGAKSGDLTTARTITLTHTHTPDLNVRFNVAVSIDSGGAMCSVLEEFPTLDRNVDAAEVDALKYPVWMGAMTLHTNHSPAKNTPPPETAIPQSRPQSNSTQGTRTARYDCLWLEILNWELDLGTATR